MGWLKYKRFAVPILSFSFKVQWKLHIFQGKFDLDSYKTVDEMIHKAVGIATKHLSDKDHINDFLTYCNMTDVKR